MRGARPRAAGRGPPAALLPLLLLLAPRRPLAEPAPPRETLLFVAVVSAPGNADKRAGARDSWMRGLRERTAGAVEAAFVVGDARDFREEARLEHEQEVHGEFVRLEVPERYEELTGKTLALLRWFAQSGPNASFLLKLDDDAFVDVERLLPVLERIPAASLAYAGSFWERREVQRSGKFAESHEAFAGTHYPRYADGGGYVLSAELVRELGLARYEESKRNALHCEDASVGLWVELLAGSRQAGRVEFVDVPASWEPGGTCPPYCPRSRFHACAEDDALFLQLRPPQMRCLWQARQEGRPLCSGGELLCDADGLAEGAAGRPPTPGTGGGTPAEL